MQNTGGKGVHSRQEAYFGSTQNTVGRYAASGGDENGSYIKNRCWQGTIYTSTRRYSCAFKAIHWWLSGARASQEMFEDMGL
jgi:hypothetical protein